MATFEGAIPEIINDGVNGFLIKQKDSIDVADKLKELINSQKLREKMGAASFLKYENKYSLEKFEQRITFILTDILENHNE